MSCHRSTLVTANILSPAALTRAVHRQQRTTHTGKGCLFQPTPACTGIAMKLQDQRHRFAADREQIFCVELFPANACKLKIHKPAGIKVWNLRSAQVIFQRDLPCLLYPNIPEHIKIFRHWICAQVNRILLQFFFCDRHPSCLLSNCASSPFSVFRIMICFISSAFSSG